MYNKKTQCKQYTLIAKSASFLEQKLFVSWSADRRINNFKTFFFSKKRKILFLQYMYTP